MEDSLRSKQERNIVKSMMGTACLDEYMEQTAEYKDGTSAEKRALKKKRLQQFGSHDSLAWSRHGEI